MGGPFKYPGKGPLFNEWAWMGIALLVEVALVVVILIIIFALAGNTGGIAGCLV